ncbi:MAG: winged helix-turn-helix domain-containing protein, partial [Ktedonobacterales bacterium]
MIGERRTARHAASPLHEGERRDLGVRLAAADVECVRARRQVPHDRHILVGGVGRAAAATRRGGVGLESGRRGRVEDLRVAARCRVNAQVDRIRPRIRGGELPQGQRLPSERELAEELAVSRTTVREALQALREEGFITAVRGRSGGTFVTDLILPQELWYERIRQNPGEL